MDPALIMRIRERAYYIWNEIGGDAEQNWLRAESEILTSSDLQPLPALTPKKQRVKSRRKSGESGVT
jgi:hypothetical protein